MATKAATIVSDTRKPSNYARYVNPQWVALLNLLDMNVEYDRCIGCELFTKDGRRILDYLSGYCVHNAGHNHPDIIEAVRPSRQTRSRDVAKPCPRDRRRAGERLCKLAGGGLAKVYFGSSGSEGVEAAIKFARATTCRAGILFARHSFHGLTAGALSLMDDEFWKEGFGPLLQDTSSVPFGDLKLWRRL